MLTQKCVQLIRDPLLQIPVPHRRTLLRFTGGAFDHKPRQEPRALACDRGTVKRMPTPDIKQPCDQPLASRCLARLRASSVGDT